MSSYEELFESSVLEVVAPQPSLEFPADYRAEQAQGWIARLRGPSGDRRTAFFGTLNSYSCETSCLAKRRREPGLSLNHSPVLYFIR